MTKQLDQFLLDQAVRLAQPLQAASAGPDATLRLADAVGWDLGAIAGVPTAQLASAVSAAATAFQDVAQTVEQGPADLTTLAGTLLACANAFTSLRQVVQGWSPTGGGLPANLLEIFADDLLAYLLDVYLSSQVPRLRAILQLGGVYQTVSAPAITRSDNTVVRRAQPRPSWNLDLLMKALTDPPGLARHLYAAPGGSPQAPAAIADLAGPLLAQALGQLGIPAHYGTPGAASDQHLTAAEQGAAQHLLHVRVAVSTDATDTAAAIFDVTLGLTELSATLAAIVAPQGQLTATRSVGNWKLGASLTGVLQPFLIGANAVTFENTAGASQLQLSTSATRDPASDGPMMRLGKPPGTRLEIGGLALSQQLLVSPPGAGLSAAIELKQAQLVVAAGDGDGFLSTVLPRDPVQLAIPLAVDWSVSKGFVVRGTEELRIDLAPHRAWGPVSISSLVLELRQDTTGPVLETSISGGLSIGPLVVNVDRLGIVMRLLTSTAGGSFGQLDVRVGFKPPDGLGLALGADPVSGAGFVTFDEVSGRYLGAMSLAVGDVSIAGVAVLDTRLPGGAQGYSLVVVVSVDFQPPVEIGFGFSLTGIGGLVGVNRTADVPSLQALARAGKLDGLMFPADLAHRAPQVAANLAQVFRPAQGHFIVGPAARIEWGTGGIVDAEVGLFIELSGSGGGVSLLRVALLGWVHLTLPDAAAPVADLTLDVLGVVDIPGKSLSLDAGLRNSAIAGFPLTGQAALRASWGANPSFVFAVGGFNPHFAVPPGFPALQRLALSIGGSDPRLRLSAYLALTSNTVQLGCSADLYASAGPAAVAASLTFDALVQFKPFGLIVDLTIAATVLLGGSPVLSVSLDLHVSGPQPWTVTGSASFQVLFCSFTVPISITVGPAPPPQPPQTVDLDANLATALGDPRSWQTGPPAGRGLVTMRTQKGASQGGASQGGAGPAVHPLGSLTVRQHAVPLEQRIERYGPDLLDAPCTYQIVTATAGGQQAPAADVTDFFAPAQFMTMTDAQKLSSPSFEPMTAGMTLGSAQLSLPVTPGTAGGPATVADALSARPWDILMLDSPNPGPAPASGTPAAVPSASAATPPAALLAAQLPGAAAAVNGAGGRGQARYAWSGSRIAVQQPSYAVVGMNLAAPRGSHPITMGIPTPTGAAGSQPAGVSGQDWQVVYTSEVPG